MSYQLNLNCENRLATANQRLATLRELHSCANLPDRRLAVDAEKSYQPNNAASSGHLAALTERLESQKRLMEPVEEQGRGDISAETIPVYTSIATAITRNKATAAGRVWLILHHYFNRNGRQLVSESEIVDLICREESSCRLFGRRQWRNIKHLGQTIFWEDANQDGFLLIHGIRHVTMALDVPRLEKGRVNIPVLHLAKSVKSAKSVLYASFDVGRKAMPISRAVRQNISGLDRVTQWRHEKQSRLIQTTANYEIICPASEQAASEEAAFTFGAAGFIFTDYKGQLGKQGERYFARQMPNCYHTHQLESVGDGRRKKFNQQLRTHVNQRGMVSKAATVEQLYYDDASTAQRAIKQDKTISVRSVQSSSNLWYQLSGK